MVAPAVFAAGISAGGSLLGGLFGSSSAKKAQKAAAEQARLDREWQERMAKNAHQYEAADLEAAGLNRILSLGGGGASPSGGAMAGVPATEAGEAAKGVTSAIEAAMAAANLENVKADTAQKSATAVNQSTQAKATAVETARNQGRSGWDTAKLLMGTQAAKGMQNIGKGVDWAAGKIRQNLSDFTSADTYRKAFEMNSAKSAMPPIVIKRRSTP